MIGSKLQAVFKLYVIGTRKLSYSNEHAQQILKHIVNSVKLDLTQTYGERRNGSNCDCRSRGSNGP